MNVAGLKEPNRNTPRRTRTFNPLIKSRPEIGPDVAARADLNGRVCGSVSERDTRPDRLEMLVEIARVIGQLPPAERAALGSMLSLVLSEVDGMR